MEVLLDKLSSLGIKMGLKGEELQRFVEKERDMVREEQDPKIEKSDKAPVELGTRQNKPKGSGDFKRNATCYVCGARGHLARECPKRNMLAAMIDKWSWETNEEGNVKEGGNIPQPETLGFMDIKNTDPHVVQARQNGCFTLQCGLEIPILGASCNPLDLNDPTMPVKRGLVGNRQVNVLRDTGCKGAVVAEKFVSSSQFTGEYKICTLMDRTLVVKYPIAEINVKTPFYTGKLQAVCMKTPICDLVLGNNISGVKGPYFDEDKPEGQALEQKQAETPLGDVNVSKPVGLGNEGTKPHPEAVENKREPLEVVGAVQTRQQKIDERKPTKPLIVTQADDRIITPEILKVKQQDDKTLHRIRQLAMSERKDREGKSNYVVKDGIIYREFESPKVEYGDSFCQLLVPLELRKKVLTLAHESVLGGHQGTKRTLDKILTNFYWPGIGADVRRFCQSCNVCQRTITKGRVPKVPLGDMPIIDTPFERIAIDLVGPIKPATDRGHRYILVLMDYATRYPEALPLRNIDTETVAEQLLGVYSRLGIPREVLTDQGSQFVSRVMKEINRLLSIHPLTTTPYHAMCNGLVERFNGTLKNMLRKMCEERPKDWDRYINPLLFAYRETTHPSTGFSPFELLLERTVRGPMSILKELWTNSQNERETKTTYQYVVDLQERLEKTCELARAEMKRAKVKNKRYYDRKAKTRTFKEGDEVLLLIPTESNKLLMQWKGPYKIEAKLNPYNYRLNLGHRRQTYHANLIKKYHRRKENEPEMRGESAFEVVAAAMIEGDSNEGEEVVEDLLYFPTLESKEAVDDVHINVGLTEEQINQIKRILGSFRDVLTDIPGKTNLGQHVIKVNDETPIKCKPYPIPHALRKEVEIEIQNMIKMGEVKRCEPNCEYAFPLFAVRKTDGTLRNCVDMRRLNQITLVDAEPIPDQEEIFALLSNDLYFTKLDLSKGYWQVPLEEGSKKYTTFVTHGGLYQFQTLPFGLINSAASFSRIMRLLLQGMQGVHSYIDDILIHSPTWEEHVHNITEVFKRLRDARLTARPSKCYIGYEQIEFLGHVVGKGHMRPKPDKVEAIKQAKRPLTKTQLRSFLGLAGYYRRFIPNFAAVACPLTDCTKKGKPNKIVWEDSQEKAFRALKYKLTTQPILHLPNLQKEFILRSDASEIGVGAVLLQEDEGEYFPVAFASKKLNKAQRAYSVIEKECFAIVWGVQKFETFLLGREFVIQTDHQPLACLKRKKIGNGRVLRWPLALQPFCYRLEVIKGKDNVGADYMSRT
ncbi:hypothetical protein HOLleu_04137 [Holothuria leucospilota]|uniref:Reverse transcriptase n=1 Tax=Holothuria leucospilota TaxID=206669 RepID=A0A9Q1CU61_HOLLE|nr:hypothetical protein HOLleu_04137 [Holothuria leucospilota]